MNTLFLFEYIDTEYCFSSTFSQYYVYSYELTYYYCYANITNILYKAIPSINFYSSDLNYTFELTSEELFTVKDGYIYIRILTDEILTV